MPINNRLVVLNSGMKICEDRPKAVVRDPEVIRAYFGEKYSRRLQAESKGGRPSWLRC